MEGLRQWGARGRVVRRGLLDKGLKEQRKSLPPATSLHPRSQLAQYQEVIKIFALVRPRQLVRVHRLSSLRQQHRPQPERPNTPSARQPYLLVFLA